MKKKKLFKTIRLEAPSWPFDFTEALKKMEIEFPYPKKINKNKYEIAPGMYYNKNGLNDYFEEWE